MGQLGDAGTQLHGAVVDIGQEAGVHAVHRHVGPCAHHRVAAEGRAVGEMCIRDRADSPPKRYLVFVVTITPPTI